MRTPLLLFAIATAVPGATARTQAGSPLGTWRGTSTCTDRQAAPACHDETVVYEVRSVPGTRDTVMMQADKVVNGAREPMGDLRLGRGADGAWSAEIGTPRVHARWSFVIHGDSMAGTLVDLPTGATTRRAAATRVPATAAPAR